MRIYFRTPVDSFNPKLLKEAMQISNHPIIANQIETHPLLQQIQMKKFLDDNNMYLIAYSPLARGKVMDIPQIVEIAKKKSIHPVQVALAWEMCKGMIPIPKATSREHIKSNFDALNITLDKSDIEKIDNITREKRLINPPFLRPKWGQI